VTGVLLAALGTLWAVALHRAFRDLDGAGSVAETAAWARSRGDS
jgi:hypothetical protein